MKPFTLHFCLLPFSFCLVLIDTHAHIHVKDFDADREAVIVRAREAGVQIINVGFEPQGNEAAAKLAQAHDDISWTAGIHPHEAPKATDQNLARIVELSHSEVGKKLVALGEMGLDYFRNRQPREVQIAVFRKQLALARELSLPAIIHCRDAFEDALRILKEENFRRAVFHCFTGTPAEAAACLERGALLSFTGIVTFPSAENVRAALKSVPAEKMMIETDCPYLSPAGMRGKRNEPAFLRETFSFLARLKNLQETDFEAVLSKTTRDFFCFPA